MNYKYLYKIKRQIVKDLLVRIHDDLTCIHINKDALELARYYEEDGHTVTERDDIYKSDILALLIAYSKESDIRVQITIKLIICNLVAIAHSMGMYLSKKDIDWYERHGCDIPTYLNSIINKEQ